MTSSPASSHSSALSAPASRCPHSILLTSTHGQTCMHHKCPHERGYGQPGHFLDPICILCLLMRTDCSNYHDYISHDICMTQCTLDSFEKKRACRAPEISIIPVSSSHQAILLFCFVSPLLCHSLPKVRTGARGPDPASFRIFKGESRHIHIPSGL
jgi:hypothetical protein